MSKDRKMKPYRAELVAIEALKWWQENYKDCPASVSICIEDFAQRVYERQDVKDESPGIPEMLKELKLRNKRRENG